MTPLAIVQCRMNSHRLPGKMLLPLHGKPLVWYAWSAAVEAFGNTNVKCAIPNSPENDRLANVLQGYGATVRRWGGQERDVLGRFHHVAHRYRTDPDSVIVRVTPDDHRKSPDALRRVASGERLAVELGGEAFTLAQLDHAHTTITDPFLREHITLALFTDPHPPAPDGVWTIDTREQLAEANGVSVQEWMRNDSDPEYLNEDAA